MDLRGIISRRISNLKRDILLSHVLQIGKPQVEFRYEISARNSAVNSAMEFRLEFQGKNLDIKFNQNSKTAFQDKIPRFKFRPGQNPAI